MRPNWLRSWEAQSPPADFVERTVLAVLQDRSERRRTSFPRRTFGALVIAAVLVAGAAAAWTVLPHRRLQPAASLSVVVEPATVQAGGVAPANATIAPSAASTDSARPPAAPPTRAVPRRPDATPRPGASAAVLDAGRRVNVPRCNCQDSICDCGEQP
jgi:hypothetical protein